MIRNQFQRVVAPPRRGEWRPYGRLFATLLFVFLQIVPSALPCCAQVESATGTQQESKEIAAAIGRLGHDSFLVREQAATQLKSIGLEARGALVDASRSPDPEVRARAQRLVELIDQISFEKRLEAFAQDVDGASGITLPGWDQYKRIVGGAAADRALFIEMHRSERELMMHAFEGQSANLAKRIQTRALRLGQGIAGGVLIRGQRQQQASEASVGSCAAMLLVSATEKKEINDQVTLAVANLSMRPPLMIALTQGPYREQIRTLVGHWLNESGSVQPAVVSRKLIVISRYSLREGLPLALRVARGDDETGVQPGGQRANAVLAVAKVGDESNVEDLKPLLDNETVCQERSAMIDGARKRITVQLRDVAIASIIHLQGRKPAEFGMLGVRRHDQTVFHIQTLGFADEKLREKVLAKWRESQ